MERIGKLVLMALLLSVALVLHYIESFFPPLAPGAKLGLANIITITSLHLLGFKESMAIVLMRSVLGPILGGSPTGILFSLAGGTLSCIVMSLLYYRFRRHFSLPGISVAGAVFHNIGQMLMASLIYGSIGILFTYLPILMLASVFTGNFIGLASKYIIKFLSSKAVNARIG
ncbi:MAG: Gx transporter family protein [Caldicoprobacterales bacterium]|jgi:heptaprenyl diphosphate synthase|nr:Gx transporter family protein [Clostridiales bacterium]